MVAVTRSLLSSVEARARFDASMIVSQDWSRSARYSSSLPGKCWYSTGLDTPARSAMSSMAAAWYPCATKTSSADSSSCARRALRGSRPPRGRWSEVVVTGAAYPRVTGRPRVAERFHIAGCPPPTPRRSGNIRGTRRVHQTSYRPSRGVAVSLPALVEPAEELTIDEVRRYSRHLIIPDVGMTGQKRLKNAKVLVIGAGGLGSPALLYLAAAGVGTLGIAEFDEVDESNLQRQIIHGQSDIGKSKALSAKESIAETNPYVRVVLHEERLDNDNVMAVFEGY